jgi:large subunit ribosomal protein L30
VAKSNKKQLKLKLIRSPHGRLAAHKATVTGLGLRRMHHEVTVADTPENRGMVNSISYMLTVEEV